MDGHFRSAVALARGFPSSSRTTPLDARRYSSHGSGISPVDRDGGNLYDQNLADASCASLVLIESLNEPDENDYIIDSPDLGGARELTTTLWYTTNKP